LTDKDPVVVGFNTGFGSGDDRLKASWLGMPALFLSIHILSHSANPSAAVPSNSLTDFKETVAAIFLFLQRIFSVF